MIGAATAPKLTTTPETVSPTLSVTSLHRRVLADLAHGVAHRAHGVAHDVDRVVDHAAAVALVALLRATWRSRGSSPAGRPSRRSPPARVQQVRGRRRRGGRWTGAWGAAGGSPRGTGSGTPRAATWTGPPGPRRARRGRPGPRDALVGEGPGGRGRRHRTFMAAVSPKTEPAASSAPAGDRATTQERLPNGQGGRMSPTAGACTAGRPAELRPSRRRSAATGTARRRRRPPRAQPHSGASAPRR